MRQGVALADAVCVQQRELAAAAGEVIDLTGLLRHYLRNEIAELAREGVRLRVIGDRERFDADIREELAAAERRTAGNTRLNLTVALSYGGRAEIVAAARACAEAAAAGRLDPARLDESTFAQFLFTADMPDPDLVIRTSGEQRLSNFLLWQAPMPSWSSSTCCGRISGPSISARPWRNSPGASGGSVHGLAEAPARKSAWGDLRVRVLSAALLAPLGLVCIWFGGWAWRCWSRWLRSGMALEWVGLCGAQIGSSPGLARARGGADRGAGGGVRRAG